MEKRGGKTVTVVDGEVTQGIQCQDGGRLDSQQGDESCCVGWGESQGTQDVDSWVSGCQFGGFGADSGQLDGQTVVFVLEGFGGFGG